MGDLIPKEILEAFRQRKQDKAQVKSLYFRWTYHPKDASVDLWDNKDSDRANRKYHLDHDPEPEAVHGYAYRIKGGWRITDWEHNPTDKFIKSQVVLAIERKENDSSS